jgi:GTPase
METIEPEIMSDALPANHRSGYVALVGKPNVGKSTLLNAWLGTRLAPVSPKPQTTRDRLLGILTRPDAQVIFVDTPGIHLPRTKLGEVMVKTAQNAALDADVVLFMVDGSEAPTRADEEIVHFLSAIHVPIILTLNKADLLAPADLPVRRAAYQALGQFTETVSLSALTGEQRDALLELTISKLPLGPRYYPEDQLSDVQERFIAAELIREQLLRILEQEVPHAMAVVVEEFKERAPEVLYIAANIYTEKDSQKGIVIGREGAMLKRIGREARVALEQFFGSKVFLDLWVKVRKNWRRDERYLRELGYVLPNDD